MIVELVGFAAWLLNVAGNVLLAHKRQSGWIVRIASIVCWGVYGFNVTSWPMVANAVTFFGINVYGFRKWHREAQWFENQRRAA